MKGSASRPSSATIKGTRCAISPETNATSRESLSSLEITTQHLALRGCRQGRGKLRPPIERIGAFAGFGLDKLLHDRDASMRPSVTRATPQARATLRQSSPH
jgi:hypothetical protein